MDIYILFWAKIKSKNNGQPLFSRRRRDVGLIIAHLVFLFPAAPLTFTSTSLGTSTAYHVLIMPV